MNENNEDFRTGACVNGQHDFCRNPECNCTCHPVLPLTLIKPVSNEEYEKNIMDMPVACGSRVDHPDDKNLLDGICANCGVAIVFSESSKNAKTKLCRKCVLKLMKDEEIFIMAVRKNEYNST